MDAFKINARFFKITSDELDAGQKELIQKAKSVVYQSISPYSKFQVGCSVIMDNGRFVVGMNVENAAYSACICAERNALTSALTQYPDAKIVSMAIAHRVDGDDTGSWISPCGECRQVMVEVAERQKADFDVLLYGNDTNMLLVKNVRDLLPLSFLPASLDM